MFCPNPFTRLEIKANGDVYCCCEGWLPKKFGNLLEQDLMKIWNSPDAIEVRRSIIDGSFRHCLACPYLPGPGGPVVEKWGQSNASAINDDLSVDYVGTLKLDYDQTCQLQCPSCRVRHSREFVDVPKVQLIHEKMLASGVLEKTLRLYVTGAGDPFASPLYWGFLKKLWQIALHPKLDIFLHTNGLLFDSSHWYELAPDTRRRVTEVGISIDASSEKTYQFIRGASWKKLWENIGFINRLQSFPETASGRPIMLGLFYTVQEANFREILPFLQLAWSHGVSWISITALRNWGTYQPDNYASRAVHLPGHPHHAEFKQVIADPRLTADPRIVLDSFNPEYVDQQVICNPGALLPESSLRRPR
jgi:radical SAM protein with 4Fe4S-binding SPASM domain